MTSKVWVHSPNLQTVFHKAAELTGPLVSTQGACASERATRMSCCVYTVLSVLKPIGQQTLKSNRYPQEAKTLKRTMVFIGQYETCTEHENLRSLTTYCISICVCVCACVRACVRACACVCVCCLLYTSPSPRDISGSRMPSSA